MAYDEKTKTKVIAELVFCPWTRTLVGADVCNKNCQFFGGALQQEAEKEVDGKKEKVIVGKVVKCHFPTMRPLQTVETIVQEEEGKEDAVQSD